MIASLSYERQLPLKMFGSVGYTWIRGVHLLRSRNINAPTSFDNGVPVVPFPSEGPILEYESNGLSTRNQMNINVRTGFSQKISVFAGYTLASMHNNTDGSNSNPANPYDLVAEWGRAGGDIRHNVFVGGLSTQRIERIVPGKEAASFHEPLFMNLGQRVRDVRTGPDGYIYFTTDDSKGRFMRVEPAQ